MPVRHVWTLTRAIVAPYCTEAGFRALRNLVGIGASTLLGNACAAGSLYLLTRHLSHEAFGAFIVAQTIQAYLFLVTGVGMGPVTIREAARAPDDLDAIVTAHFLLNLTAALLLGAVVALGAVLAPLETPARWLVVILMAGNVVASLYPLPLFDLHHRQGLGTVFSLVGEVLALGALLTLTCLGPLTLPWVGLVFAGKWASVSLLQAATYHLAVRPLRWRLCRATLRRMGRSAWPTGLAALVALLPLNAGVFFVGLLRDEAEAGLYGLAYQVTFAYLIFAALGTRILQPHIAGPHGLEQSFVRKLLLFAVGYNAAVATLALSAGFLLITLFLDPYYRGALVPMTFLVVAATFNTGQALATMYLVRFERERFLFALQASVAVGFVVGCLLLTAFSLAVPSMLAAGLLLIGLLIAVARCVRLGRVWAAPGDTIAVTAVASDR